MMENLKRVTLADGLRGLSLFGILLANLLIFQYGIFGKDEVVLSGADGSAYTFTKIFIEGSFMPIFTFLFGFSMIKMSASLKKRDLKVKRYFARRSLLLIVIGIVHSTYLWEGDILLFYGVMGFFLLMFINRSKRTILMWAAMLTVLLNAVMLIGLNSGEETLEAGDFTFSETDFPVSEAYLKKTDDIYANGTYQEIYEHRNSEEAMEEMSEVMAALLLILAPLITAPMFLFGMYAAQMDLFSNPLREIKLYKIGMWILLPAGLLMKAIAYMQPGTGWTDFLIMSGGPILAAGYVFAFAWLYTKYAPSIVMQAFESVGKLSLTNYVMQTVICTTIFYGYGLGLFGKLGTLNGIFLGLGIFCFQCIASHFYVRIFRRGPIEYILRMWTNFSWNSQVKPKRKKIKKVVYKFES